MARRKQEAAAPAAAAPAPTAPAEQVEPQLVECAVLHDCEYGKHDDIVRLPPSVAEAARAANCVDPHPNAVKAIRSRG